MLKQFDNRLSIIHKVGVFFLLIFILALLNFYLFYISDSNNNAVYIKQAEKSQMLSQRIAFHAVLINSENDNHKQILANSIKAHDETLNLLKNGGSLRINDKEKSYDGIYEDFPNEISEADSVWQAFKKNSLLLLDKESSPTEKSQAIHYITENSEQMLEKNKQLAKAVTKENLESYQTLSRIIWSILILNLIVIIGGLINIQKKVLLPLKKILPYFINISNGQLGYRLKTERSDEIGKLIAAFNKMNEKLSETVQEIKRGADTIVQGSDEISKGSQTLSEGAGQQAASAEEVSSSVEQLTSTIELNTNNAVETEEKAKEAVKAMHMIMRAGKKSVEAINTITEKVTIINDIAFQTNLLSLNASIEAKKAGELGKGFTAVANQIRKLAAKSRLAADEISELSDSSRKTILKTNDIIGRMSPEIDSTASLAKGVANSAKEQKAGVDQINTAIQEMNDVTQKSAAVSEELASEAEEFSSIAETLKATISNFDTTDKGIVDLKKKKVDDDLLEWGKKYSIGLDEIDGEHKILIGLINKLYKSYGNTSDKRKTRKIIDELLDYTIYHFGTEEEYFEKFDYPGKKNHIAQHKIFINKIKDFKEKFKAGTDTAIGFDIIDFLMKWFVNHILKVDVKYVETFKEHGVK